MTPRSQAADVLPPDSVRRTILANGLRVLVRRDTSAPVVAIVTWVRAGYFDEPDDVVGISHVLEHMYFKGTPSRGVGEIARATKAVGGYLNAATIYDHTHYYVVLPASGFATGLEVQADAYANSLIDRGELARELEVIIEETKRKADTPAALAVEVLFETLHDQHRIRRWRMGRESGLRALTRDQLLAFYRQYYRPSNTVLAIVGDVDPDEAIARVTACYGHLADGPVARGDAGPRESAPPGFRVREWEGDLAQAELLLGWRTPGLEHPDTPALDVLATILAGGRASRLMRAARDRRLVSSVSAYDYTPGEIGVFVIHAGARPQTMQAAARTIWDQLRRIRDGELTTGEVERARALLEARWLRSVEAADGQANFLGAWELQGDWQQGIAHHERMMSADRDALTGAAGRWLRADDATLLAYRPRGSAPLGEDAAAIRSMLDESRPAPLQPAGRPTTPAILRGAGARFEGVEAGVHLFRTQSGVPVLVKPRPGATLAHLGVFVEGGVTSEEVGTSGLTTLMARSMLRGTSRRSATQLAEDAERLGGSPLASVGTEAFQWTLGVPRRSFAGAADLLADLVLDPRFPSDGVEAERAVAIAAIASLRDDMYRQPMRLAAEEAWPGHPYGRTTMGTEESVSALGVDSLRAWHAARVPEAPIAIVAVGDLEPAAAADEIARRFAAMRPGSATAIATPRWTTTQRERVETRDKAQSAIALFFDGPARHEAARFDAELLGGVASGLGGRFFEELRDKRSLAYSVLARPFVRTRAGTFAAYIATSPEKEEEARDGLLREFARFVEVEVSSEELDRARTYAIGAWQIRQTSGAAVLSDVAEAWLHGSLAELASYPADVAGVTPARMRGLAERWFDPARRVEGIVRGNRSPGSVTGASAPPISVPSPAGNPATH